MAGIICKVTKQYDDYVIDQLIEVDENDVRRLERRGRIKRVPNNRVDRLRLPVLPPSIEQSTPGQAPRTQRMIFVDKRDIKHDENPTLVFNPIKAEAGITTPIVGPPEDRADRSPVASFVGPDLKRPIAADETKYQPSIELVQTSQFWWQIRVNGKVIQNDSGKPRNFRKPDAEAARKRLQEGKDI